MHKNTLPTFRPKKSPGEIVPMKFVAFLRASLAKLAGNHYIAADLIDMEFWAKMPLKFSAVKFYDKSLVIKTFTIWSKKYKCYVISTLS